MIFVSNSAGAWVDTVQPCDTNQARSDLDFGVNVSTVQFYPIELDPMLDLKLYSIA